MADKKEKKLEHIQVKDNGIKLSEKIGDTLADLKATLESKLQLNLLKGVDNPSTWVIRQNNLIRDYKKEALDLVKKANKEVKSQLKNDETVNLTNKQALKISNAIDKGTLFLGNSATKAYQNSVSKTLLTIRSNKAIELKEALLRHLQSSLDIGVVYKDDKHYQFDTYWEMKARTDIQNDIGSNMVDTGHKNGVIFYISTFYGDCAKDHANYQGRIYYDEDWKSIAPKDRYDEIESYIAKLDAEAKSLELSDGSVNTVMNNKPFLTTRPNCRHYFQYIDIDSVLGAKTKEDVSKLRAERNLNFNGKYKPEKYKALQQQRANERKIRAEKQAIDKLEHELALKPGDKNIQSAILNGEANIRRYQAAQRKLENEILRNKKGEIIKDKQGKPKKKYDNIRRNYSREALGNRVTLGVDKSQDLTLNENKGKIRIGENPNSIMASISDSKMEYVEVQKLESPLTSNQIVSKLMGKDETAGSCSSLALAYIGNKHGYDVTDYRGGESSDFFATPSNVRKIAEKYNGLIVEGKDEIQMVNSLLQQIDENKEYYVVCGEHASIIKNVKGKWKYAEFQDVKKIGFHKFDDEAMKKRFSCSSRRKFETFAIMVDIDNFNDEDFKNILGFINTKKKD